MFYYMIMIDKTTQAKIRKIAKKRWLDLVLVFGSTARGTTHASSDIDLAVLSHKPGELSIVAEEFGNVLKRNDVEVTDLAHASPYLMRAVAEDGALIFESKKDFFTEWKIHARNVWFDTAWFRARQKRALQLWARNQ